MSPKSMSASFPLDSSCSFIKFPGWGSQWKKPSCSSWVRKASWPIATSSLTSSGSHSVSFFPSTHSVTSR